MTVDIPIDIISDSQVAHLTEEIIEYDDLPERRDSWPPQHSRPDSSILLKEIATAKHRIGFDEQEFRENCQRYQSELAQSFKDKVDEIYDSLDNCISSLSKALYQVQLEELRNFEEQLVHIRKTMIAAENSERAIEKFLSQVQAAFRENFGN